MLKLIKLVAVSFIIAVALFQYSCKPANTKYEVAMADQIIVETDTSGNVNLNISEKNVITGHISHRNAKEFSFNISDTSYLNQIFDKGDVISADGDFEDSEEDFYIEIDERTAEGEYFLSFYTAAVDKQSQLGSSFIYKLKIVKD